MRKRVAVFKISRRLNSVYEYLEQATEELDKALLLNKVIELPWREVLSEYLKIKDGLREILLSLRLIFTLEIWLRNNTAESLIKFARDNTMANSISTAYFYIRSAHKILISDVS